MVAYAWYKCGERMDSRAEAFALAGLGYSLASLEAGLLPAMVLNFVVGVGMVSFYLYAKNASRCKTHRGRCSPDRTSMSRRALTLCLAHVGEQV